MTEGPTFTGKLVLPEPPDAFFESMAKLYAMQSWGSWENWPDGDRQVLTARMKRAYMESAHLLIDRQNPGDPA